MNILLILAFLFFIGSCVGWVIELLYRNLIDKEGASGKKWINPGLCTGPYLPIYGCGLCLFYLVSLLDNVPMIHQLPLHRLWLFLIMSLLASTIELIAGLFCKHVLKVELWDYSDEKFNLWGVICLKFSFYWALIGAVYYFCIHEHILGALEWLSQNLTFSFFIGMFFGVFILDIAEAMQLVKKLRRFAKDNQMEFKFENIKKYIRNKHKERELKYHFFRPFKTVTTIKELLEEIKEKYDRDNNESHHKPS